MCVFNSSINKLYLILCFLFINESHQELIGNFEEGVSNSQQLCSNRQFKCNADNSCISVTQVCDGTVDCSDGQDEFEAKCRLKVCPLLSFRCHYGGCIHANLECNGVVECPDESDEDDCADKENDKDYCGPGEFECNSGECIRRVDRCNGINNCEDGSDEMLIACRNKKCFPGTFQCDYGGCIAESNRCDGKQDCSDNSDEHPILCGYTAKHQPPIPVPRLAPGQKPVRPGPNYCEIPGPPLNGNYKLITNVEHADQVPHEGAYTRDNILYTCDPTFKLSTGSNNILLCVSGNWSTEIPKCLGTCIPPSSNKVDFECFTDGKNVSCEERVSEGSYIEMKCKDYYDLNKPSATNPQNKTAFCRNDRWEGILLDCSPRCGIIPRGKPTIVGGEDTSIDFHPWHVGLYRRINGTYTYICGGSLLNPSAVVTAAHCVTDSQTGKAYDASLYRLATGKTFKNLNNPKDEDEEVITEIEDIVIADGYKGEVSQYEHDIALLKLKLDLTLNSKTIPICVDFSNPKYDETIDKEGTVVGWGETQTNVTDTVLQMLRLVIEPSSECEEIIRKESPDFTQYVRADKFCAGSPNRTGAVAPGDSGGGFITTKGDDGVIHFLRGITSTSPFVKGKTTRIATFTRIANYLDFIKQATVWYSKDAYH